MISEEVDRWFREGDVEDPISTSVPLKRGGHLAGYLKEMIEGCKGQRRFVGRRKGHREKREDVSELTRQFSAQTNSFVLIEEVTTSWLRCRIIELLYPSWLETIPIE